MGCATAGTLQNGVYRGEQTSYQIGPVGPDWTPVTVGHQNDLAWHNEAKGAVMHADSDCDSGLDIPLTALRSHLMIGFTDREVIDEEDALHGEARRRTARHLAANFEEGRLRLRLRSDYARRAWLRRGPGGL